jgi:predicted metal-dependent phosphoesterase TrpH
MGIADLHVHTINSFDGTATVPSVLQKASLIGLDLIAITDHDQIHGALQAEQNGPKYGLEVIPGAEITTADGDLLALNIHELPPAGLSFRETVIRTGELGGFCIVPHPGAGGMGMKSLSFDLINRALSDQEIRPTLYGIETYNATVFDRRSNLIAQIWARYMGLAQIGCSDAHLLAAIGLGTTIFPGKTALDLMVALQKGTTRMRKGPEWSSVHLLGKWLVDYLISTPGRLDLSFAWRR